MNCNCYNQTSEKHTLKIRKGNTINLRLRYTINDKQPTEEDVRNTRVYLINPYNQKREIHNFKLNESNELELSLTESTLGEYSIELAYLGETNQATYDFENVFEIVGKSSEESELTDSELINKEVTLSGHLSVGYDRDAINEIKERLSNLEGNNGTSECDCEQLKRDITSILSDIGSLQSKVSTMEQSTLSLDDVLSEMNTDIRDLEHKIRVAPTNKDLQDLIKRITVLENGTFVRPATPVEVVAKPVENPPYPTGDSIITITPDVVYIPDKVKPDEVDPTTAPDKVKPEEVATPTPPNNDGGNDRYDRTPIGPFDHDSIGGFETNGDEI